MTGPRAAGQASPAGNGFDLIVVGGGPAGSVLAALVARTGARVLLLERAYHPRYLIGESLLPATINGVCKLLGVEREMRAAGFPRKLGGTFRWGPSPEVWTLNFGSAAGVGDPQDADRVTAYEVERSRFDGILLEAARRDGVEVREGHEVVGLRHADGRVVGVDYAGPDGEVQVARARFVADALGYASRLAREGGRRLASRHYRNVALYGYFQGGGRLPPPNDGNVLFEDFGTGWVWYIPLAHGLTSVGAVVTEERASTIQGDPEGAFSSFLDQCPRVSKLLGDAPRCVEQPYDELRVRSDFSYCRERFWRPGMVLVGDAACFIDVLLSSGVHLATYSALLAARSINAALSGELEEEHCLNEFELRYRLEFSKFYQLLMGLYDRSQTPDAYHSWLRRWLRGTHGFSLGLEEIVDDVVRSQAPTSPRSAAVRVAALRKLNADLLVSAPGPTAMDDIRPLPNVTPTLVRTDDTLRWTLPS